MTMGGSESGRTSTVKLQEAELPSESKAVQVTMFVPMGKNVPDGGVQTTDVIDPQWLNAIGPG